MRRPEPLPTPPRREPEPPSDDESRADGGATEAEGGGTASPRRADRDVDASAPNPDADTDVIDDGGVFVRSDELAPVVAIGAERDDRSTGRRGSAQQAVLDDAPVDGEALAEPRGESVASTRRRDVWRAARARRTTLRRERRRFTASSRRRRRIWLISIGAILVVIAGSFGAAYSPLFAVRDISVVGASTVDAAAVEKALAGQLDRPLASVDTAAIRDELAPFAAIETYSVEARPPHSLVVRIVERTPVGVVEQGGAFSTVDAAGVVLGESRTQPKGQPVLSVKGGTDTEAFRALGAVIRSLPADLRARIATGTATTANDVSLTLTETGTTVVWGSAEQSAKKAQVLAAAMIARTPDTVTLYDVSSPHAVIIR